MHFPIWHVQFSHFPSKYILCDTEHPLHNMHTRTSCTSDYILLMLTSYQCHPIYLFKPELLISHTYAVITLTLLWPVLWFWLFVLSVTVPVLIILFCLAPSQANPVDTKSSVPSKILTHWNDWQDYSLPLPLNILTCRSCWHWVMNLQVALIL